MYLQQQLLNVNNNMYVMKPAHKNIEKIDQRLRNKPL